MAQRSYAESGKLLKQGPIEPCYYFHGPVDLLKDEALSDLLDRLLDPSLRDFNLDQRSAPDLQPADVETLCATLPMMAERRVVVIRDVEAWARKPKAKAAVLQYLAHAAPETVLVLVQGSGEEKPDPDLADRATTIVFEPLRRDHAERWLQRRAASRGVSLAPDAAEHLLAVLGDELGLLAAELDKLAGLGGSEPVSLAQVEALLGVRHGETPEDWCRAVLRGETGKAAAMLPHLLEQPGVNGVRLLMLLGTHLVGVALVRAHVERGVRGRALQQAAFDAMRRIRLWGMSWGPTAALWAAAAPEWTEARLRSALRAARDADQALKTTNISGEGGVLTNLVLGLARPAREAA